MSEITTIGLDLCFPPPLPTRFLLRAHFRANFVVGHGPATWLGRRVNESDTPCTERTDSAQDLAQDFTEQLSRRTKQHANEPNARPARSPKGRGGAPCTGHLPSV
jgi:hypothetical protein